MARCAAIKPNGERCKGQAASGKSWCTFHDPARAEAQKRAARKGGQARAMSRDVREVRALMDRITEQVQDGQLEPAILYAVVAASNTKLRAVELERKLEEADVRAEFEELKRALGITA
jgi:hypothetical protein